MDVKKILLTGATGFIGSHVAESLCNEGYKIIAIKRQKSDLWRCHGFKDKITWVDVENQEILKNAVLDFAPQILIHAAWSGVTAQERDSWIEQQKNLSFFTKLLELANISGIEKIIALGSQAEYGFYSGIVNEQHICNPISAYGCFKLCASEILKSFSIQKNIEWYWLRIFSVFGPREGKTWLIPATIQNLLQNKEMALTLCEQEYDYLYVKDLAYAVNKIILENKDKSGFYNISSNKSVKLKEILSFVQKQIMTDKILLKFGELEYRKNQVMKMQGDSTKFYNTFSYCPKYDFYNSLIETINFYKKY